MKFFDSCTRRVSLAEVSNDVARDIAFNEFLRKRHEAREREKADAMKKAREKETMNNGKKTGNR